MANNQKLSYAKKQPEENSNNKLSYAKKQQLEKDIRLLSSQLKEKMKIYKGLENTKQINEIGRIDKMINAKIDKYKNIVYRFKCPRCNSTDTKRTGLTTQLETKARFFCFNCDLKNKESYEINKNKDNFTHTFFVLSNNEIENIINNDESINEKQKEFFLKKYKIVR